MSFKIVGVLVNLLFQINIRCQRPLDPQISEKKRKTKFGAEGEQGGLGANQIDVLIAQPLMSDGPFV
jgi:hypothetical protein